MAIELVNPFTHHQLLLSEAGLIEDSHVVFPFVNGAYRIVTEKNYTDNFGFQWDKFALTQIDSNTNLDLSKKRFFTTTDWHNEDLNGKNILEVGSGAGRFTQIVLDYTNANLYSVDFSDAVTANFNNNGPNPRLHLFQASIYEMPFRPEQFDKVFCFGVLQHTPDFEKSIRSLANMVKPGGELVVDFYPINGWWTKVQAKYILRPFTKKMDHQQLYNKIERNIDGMIKAHKFFSKIGISKIANRFLPLCDINGTLPENLPYQQLRELCLLDTFDMFSPVYDNPQKIRTVTKWFEKYNMTDVWGGVKKFDNYSAAVVKGIKK
jgi:ubiquinone/menaquinone biosynthesis C-methylase UbiE